MLVQNLKTWWHPPPTEGEIGEPNPDSYYRKCMFLWMPRRMWRVNFHCPHCMPLQSLRSKGVYNRVRLVLDIKDYYYLMGEYMECGVCGRKFISWDDRMLQQLVDGVRGRFSAILTRKYAADKAVVSLLRARTLGNSPTALASNLQEAHSGEWLQKTLSYLSDCEHHKKGAQTFHYPVPLYRAAPSFPTFSGARWFLSVYVRDVWSRLPALLAAATSVYGSILKIDSTKKITKKLQGKAANTAAWCTNVGNERGELVVSVLTASESWESLQRLADGLVERYQSVGQPAPRLLYTDRDCCCGSGPSKFMSLFESWDQLQVRLDIWHWMRRMGGGCTTESHPLYGIFMSGKVIP